MIVQLLLHPIFSHIHFHVDITFSGTSIPIVRTRFDLNPEQEWTQAQKDRTINL